MEKRHIEALQSRIRQGVFKTQEPMKRHTTFKIGGPADIYVEPTITELPDILSYAAKENLPYTIIGNGSNLLVADAGIRGLVIGMGPKMGSIDVQKNTVTAEAGATLAAVALTAQKNGLGGMEFASGIPGSVGGAVFMNAGAYGGEMRDILIEVMTVDRQGNTHRYTKEEMELSYRYSVFQKKDEVIAQATLLLEKQKPEQILLKMQDFNKRRREKQPLEYPSAGSTFKRPEGFFAGKLIQDSGLAGYRVGDAGVSEKHCGFVINYGNATAEEVRQLILDVIRIVQQKQGVRMEPEIRLIGEF